MSVLAHDLRSPLTVIRGTATLLIQAHLELPPERVATLLEVIETQAAQMADKVEDLLVAARLDGDRLHLMDEDTDLGGVVATALDAARRAAPGRRIRAAGVIDGILVHADADRVAQVLRILLDNAVRYSPESSWIDLRAEQRANDVRIEVRDRGVGVPASESTRIFERFERLDTGGHGSGLGLYVARGLARSMAGECDCEARPGGGSVFWFTLPTARKK